MGKTPSHMMNELTLGEYENYKILYSSERILLIDRLEELFGWNIYHTYLSKGWIGKDAKNRMNPSDFLIYSREAKPKQEITGQEQYERIKHQLQMIDKAKGINRGTSGNEKSKC